MRNQYTREQVVDMLRTRQAGRPAAALAREIGITRAYLGDIYKSRRNPGPRVLSALGLRAETKIETIYRKVA